MPAQPGFLAIPRLSLGAVSRVEPALGMTLGEDS